MPTLAGNAARLHATWRGVLNSLGLPNAQLLWQSATDPARRLYVDSNTIYKIRVFDWDLTAPQRRNDLREEFRLLVKAGGIYGVPQGFRYFRTPIFEAFSMQRVESSHSRLGGWSIVRILFSAARFILVLSCRGVSHNDYKLQNFLITSEGACYIVDFDQACEATPLTCLFAGFTGILVTSKSISSTSGSLLTVIKEIAMTSMPSLTNALKRLIRRAKYSRLPDISADAPLAVQALKQAWMIAQRSHASSPGEPVAYYELNYGGYRFPGERPWNDRWNQIERLIDVKGKRILELGCNLALLSNWMLLHKGATTAHAVDIDAQILDAAQIASEAFGTSITFAQINFDSPEDWEAKLLGESADVVFALSVLNWVKDKDRLVRFLAKHREVLFEGHDSADIEESRLRRCGFSKVVRVGVSERNRSMFYCSAA